jgi:hypothetical protein
MKDEHPEQVYTRGAEPISRPLASVLAEHDLFTSQRESRRELLKGIEKILGDGEAVIAFICSEGGAIDSRDVTAIGDVLMSVGDVKALNLIIDSPGGDGATAEKLIGLCRAYCKTFRVIVPHRAKSAATIIALGADEIQMGHCSEIGPIDAQVMVLSGGIPRYISAQSFIDARESLEGAFQKRIKEDSKANVRDILTQLATLDMPFIDHCTKLMEFSRAVAQENLERYMFARIKNPTSRAEKIRKVIEQLSRPSVFQVHARMIDANAAKTRLGLNVKILPKDNKLWESVWQYYIRADVFLSGRHGLPASKMVESRSESLFMAASIR